MKIQPAEDSTALWSLPGSADGQPVNLKLTLDGEAQLVEGGQIILSPKDRVGSPLLGNVDTQRNTWPVLGTVKSDHQLGPLTFAFEPDLLRTAGPWV